MDTDEARFADSVRELRERNGWSQGELARRMVDEGWATYSQMTVSRTEKHERPIRLSEARALARVLGSDVELMSGYRSAHNEQAGMALLRSASADVKRAADRLMAALLDAMEQASRAAAAADAIAGTRPLASAELDLVATSYIEEIGRQVDLINSVTSSLHRAQLAADVHDAADEFEESEGMHDLESEVNDIASLMIVARDRSHEPHDAFEREVLVLFGDLNGEHQAEA